MEITPLGIEGAWLASSPVWADERGSFREWFKSADIESVAGNQFDVRQANISVSSKGVIRGIHYSLAAVGQAKCVTCVSGEVRDVIVDIRPYSPTYGKHIVVDLVGGDGQVVLIGLGLGHGFASLQDDSVVAYLVSSPFSPAEEFEINPLDPALGIDWGLPAGDLRFSEKDERAPSLARQAHEGRLPKVQQ